MNNIHEPLNDISDEEFYNLGSASNTEEIIQRKTSKEIRDMNGFFASNNFLVEKGDQTCNIIDQAKHCNYRIPISHLEEFFSHLDICRQRGLSLHYLERQTTNTMSHSGIMIDFDRYQKGKDNQLDEKHFAQLTSSITKLLTDCIDFEKHSTPDGDFTFHIFVIRKPEIRVVRSELLNEIKYKDGFHILIPEIQVIKGLKKFLNDELIKRGHIKRVFDRIDNIEPPEKMLDKASASNPVFFFGSCKMGSTAYKLQHAYEITVSTYNNTMIKVLNVDDITNCGDDKSKRVCANLTYELSLGFYLESFGSGKTWLKKRNFDYKIHLETQIQLLVEKASGGILDGDDVQTIDKSVNILATCDAEAKYIKQLLDIIDVSYASEYEKWFTTICAIANTSHKYKDLAIQFSHRKPESWSQIEIDRVWNEAINSRKRERLASKRSIMYWARISSPDRYREIHAQHYETMLRNYVYDNEGRVEHAMVARLLREMIGDKFIVDADITDTGNKHYNWYEFVFPEQSMQHGQVFKWRREADPDNIHLFMADHLTKIYKGVAEDIKKKKDEAKNEPHMKYLSNVENTFRKYMSKLSENGFQIGTIRQAQYRFRCRGFINELDSYEDIIGVGNGVLKLGLKAELITGVHDYRISKYTDTNYVPYNPENPYVKELLRIFSEIYPEHDVCEFMLFYFSTAVDAREAACILLLTVGGGQNGKSFPLKMIHDTLGNQYAGCGKVSLLSCANERAEAANSAQMQMEGKLFFYFEEANKCETLNSSRVKTIVSPGYQSGRDLHQKQKNFKNTSNPIAASNFDYIIDTTDHGTWRRIYYYRNKVKFCANPEASKFPFERSENKTILRDYPRDSNYRQAMLSILVHYNERLRKEYQGDLKSIPVPTIARETYQFRNRQDAIHRFISENIIKSPDVDATPLSVISLRYQEWYNANIKHMSHNGVEITAQFENSCIANHLEYRSSGHLFLTKHRLRSSPEEVLAPGETSYSLDTNKLPETILSAPIVTASVAVGAASAIVDDFSDIITLTNREPNFIQKSDHYVEPVIDVNFDELVDNIANSGIELINDSNSIHN